MSELEARYPVPENPPEHWAYKWIWVPGIAEQHETAEEAIAKLAFPEGTWVINPDWECNARRDKIMARCPLEKRSETTWDPYRADGNFPWPLNSN